MSEDANGLPALPKGWVWATLGEITQDVQKTNPREKPDRQFWYLDISSIDNAHQRIVAPKRYVGKDAPSRARQMVRAGDILFSTVRTYLKNTAVVQEVYDGQIASTGFCVLRAASPISGRFVFFLTLTDAFVNRLTELQRGTSYPAVRNSDVLVQTTPLPPLAEQRRIVAKIEELFTQLDAGVEALKRVKAQLNRYRQAVLKHAFEGKLTQEWREAHRDELEPATVLLARIRGERAKKANGRKRGRKEPPPLDTAELPEPVDGWVGTRVGEIYDIIGGGTPSTKVTEYWDGDVPWITSADIHGPKDIRPRRHITEAAIQGSATNLVPARSLIVVTRVGLGKVALTPVPICFSQDSQALVGAVSHVHPEYALHYLSRAVQVFKYRNRGTTIGGVTKKQLAELPFALPPLAEQRRIVLEIERRLSIAEEIEKDVPRSLFRAQRLRQSILKRAFEGKLVSQDPSDEPAERLLERIKREKQRREAERKARPRGRRKKSMQRRQL